MTYVVSTRRRDIWVLFAKHVYNTHTAADLSAYCIIQWDSFQHIVCRHCCFDDDQIFIVHVLWEKAFRKHWKDKWMPVAALKRDVPTSAQAGRYHHSNTAFLQLCMFGAMSQSCRKSFSYIVTFRRNVETVFRTHTHTHIHIDTNPTELKPRIDGVVAHRGHRWCRTTVAAATIYPPMCLRCALATLVYTSISHLFINTHMPMCMCGLSDCW